VEIPPETCTAVADINKLYIVASCWVIIDTYYAMHGSLKIKFMYIVTYTVNFTADASVRYQCKQYGVYSGERETGTGTFPNTSISPVSISPPVLYFYSL